MFYVKEDMGKDFWILYKTIAVVRGWLSEKH